MAEILRRKTTLRVEQACGGERIVAGCIYFAPPDNHLVVNRDRTLRLDHSDRVHFVRPSADVLFESVAGSFDKQLRRCLIFGRHDLIQDAPISHVDILTCRNTLMYFNGESQAKIMSRFYFALAEGGVLVLGKAEMMSGYARAFVPVDLKRRMFSPRPQAGDP